MSHLQGMPICTGFSNHVWWHRRVFSWGISKWDVPLGMPVIPIYNVWPPIVAGWFLNPSIWILNIVYYNVLYSYIRIINSSDWSYMFTNFAISTHFVFAMMVSLSPKIRWLNGWSLGIIGWSDWFRISQNPKKMMFYDVMWCYLLQKNTRYVLDSNKKRDP